MRTGFLSYLFKFYCLKFSITYPLYVIPICPAFREVAFRQEGVLFMVGNIFIKNKLLSVAKNRLRKIRVHGNNSLAYNVIKLRIYRTYFDRRNMTSALSVRVCRRPWVGVSVSKTLNLMTVALRMIRRLRMSLV